MDYPDTFSFTRNSSDVVRTPVPHINRQISRISDLGCVRYNRKIKISDYEIIFFKNCYKDNSTNDNCVELTCLF